MYFSVNRKVTASLTDFLNEEGRCFRFGNTFTRFENVQFFTLLRFRLEIDSIMNALSMETNHTMENISVQNRLEKLKHGGNKVIL